MRIMIFSILVLSSFFYIACKTLPTEEKIESVPTPEGISLQETEIPQIDLESIKPAEGISIETEEEGMQNESLEIVPLESAAAPLEIIPLENFPLEKVPLEGYEENDISSFAVSEELYTKTFYDIEYFIENLNAIILSEKYTTWLSYLTEEYKTRYSNADVLNQISEEPKLKSNNIRLYTLEDYFHYVVVTARENVKLDKIIFIDNNHIKAITVIDEVPYLLYLLEMVEGEWKIGIW